ncbi:MAG TPA: hypothetical protein VF269_07150 [Rhodanobacteraceae bacterium]
MAVMHNFLAHEDDPGVLSTDDARIPDEVRARVGEYPGGVTGVVPVIGISREEWWLFDADGALIDVLIRHTSTPGEQKTGTE